MAPKAKGRAKAKAKAMALSPPAAKAVGQLTELFQRADIDGNGTISENELSVLLQMVNPSLIPERAGALIANSDCNDDGQLDIAEFILWLFGDSSEGEGQLLNAISASADSPVSGRLKDMDPEFDPEFDDMQEALIAKSNEVIEATLSDAMSAALERYPDCAAQIRAHFEDAKTRIATSAFADRVTGCFAAKLDANGDGTLSRVEVSALIRPALDSIADLECLKAPEDHQIQMFFDAHDTLSFGKGQIGATEFFNLMKHLNIQLSADVIPHLVAGWRKQV